MQAQALLGSIPAGTVRATPERPVPTILSKLGVRASSKQDRLPRSGKGQPAAPSIMTTQYFKGCPQKKKSKALNIEQLQNRSSELTEYHAAV
jgi:hypothetical protein